MTYFQTRYERPDRLTKGDYVYDPNTKNWEPVKDAYWSELIQRYVVYCGPLGGCMHTHLRGSTVQARRYY